MAGLENIERLKNFFKVIDQEKFLKEKKIEYYYIEPHISFLKEIEKELKTLEIIANADTKTLLHYLATVIVNEEDWLLCKETIEKYKRC